MKGEKTNHEHNTIIILHNIRSAHNVGAIFRTADGAGVRKIYLTGYTPSPIDRFGRVRSDIHKTALGAEEAVSWEAVEDIALVINTLKQAGYAIVAVEQHERSIDFKTYKRSPKTAYVFGNERDGLPPAVLDMSNDFIEIPMKGAKESLNVATCVGIVLFL